MIQAILAFLAMLAQLLQPAPVYEHTMTGVASWYESGTKTACKEPWHDFDPDGLSIAIQDFDQSVCGTMARVEFEGTVVYAVINDRQPYHRAYIADLSRGTRKALGMKGSGQVTISY